MNDLAPKFDHISIYICLDDILGVPTLYRDASLYILFEINGMDLRRVKTGVILDASENAFSNTCRVFSDF